MFGRKTIERVRGSWSASRLYSFSECLRHFYYSYVLSERERMELQRESGFFLYPAEMAFSDSVHYMLSRFYSVRFKSAKSFAGQMYGHWRGVAERRHPTKGFTPRGEKEKFDLARPLDYRTGQNERTFNDLIFPIAYIFYEKNIDYRDGRRPRPVLEKRLSASLIIPLRSAEDKTEVEPKIRININGQIDCLQPLRHGDFPNDQPPFRIKDYETGFLPGPEHARRAQQQTLYRLLCALVFGYEAEGFDYLAIPSYRMEIVNFTRQGRELENVLTQVEEWVKEAWVITTACMDVSAEDTLRDLRWQLIQPSVIRPGEFTPHPGNRCERCQYKRICQLGSTARLSGITGRLKVVEKREKSGQHLLPMNIPEAHQSNMQSESFEES